MTRDEVIGTMMALSRSLFARGYTTSTGGNLSHRVDDGFLVSATNTSFARLEPGDFSRCDLDATPIEGPKPSKEAPFHAAILRARPDAHAVLHLHSPGALALSSLAEPTDHGNVLPVLSSYAVTKVGRVPMLEYLTPGAPDLARRVFEVCAGVNAILLQNHGLITLAPTMLEAGDIAEEFETNVRAWLDTHGLARVLSDDELERSNRASRAPIAPGTQRPKLLPGVAFGRPG